MHASLRLNRTLGLRPCDEWPTLGSRLEFDMRTPLDSIAIGLWPYDVWLTLGAWLKAWCAYPTAAQLHT